MAAKDPLHSVYQALASQLEQAIDLLIEDRTDRKRFRNDVLKRLADLAGNSQEPHVTGFDGLQLSTSSLIKVGHTVGKWFLTAAPFIIYEAVKVIAPYIHH